MGTLPRHTVTIVYDKKLNAHIVECNVCGILDQPHSWSRANQLRTEHHVENRDRTNADKIHPVVISYNRTFDDYTVTCGFCGRLSGIHKTWMKAVNRKLTHERGQDAGAT